MSLIGGARFVSSSLALAEPGGSPAAARQLGATTGFGGSWVTVLAAAGLAVASAAAELLDGDGTAGSPGFGAAAGCWAVAGDGMTAGVAGSGAGSAGAGLAIFGGGAVALRSLAARAGVSCPGALGINQADTLPNTNPNVTPANNRAAAANVRRRSISASFCI
jgi:hypothetical protein